MTCAMSPAPITPTRRRVPVELDATEDVVATVDGGIVGLPGAAMARTHRRDRVEIKRPAYGSMALQRCNRGARRIGVRLALVTEGMIHRSIDDLMDWLDAAAPDVRELEVGTGGYSPLGHSPLALSSAGRRVWHARITARGFRIAAFNVSGNPLHPKASI